MTLQTVTIPWDHPISWMEVAAKVGFMPDRIEMHIDESAEVSLEVIKEEKEENSLTTVQG